jgi:hypothetical protein
MVDFIDFDLRTAAIVIAAIIIVIVVIIYVWGQLAYLGY